MSASASVLQLCRAHYNRDESGFTSAAMAIARSAKVASVGQSILDVVRDGVANQRRNAKNQPRPMQPQALVAPRSNGMLEELAAVTFADLVLEPSLQLLLDEIVVELEYSEDLLTRKLRPRNRLLFWGPPGCGKSSAGAAIANQLGRTAYGVSLPNVISKYIGETGQNLGKLFEHITPSTVMVLDEIDALGASRGSVEHSAGKEFNSTVNTLLTLLDRNRSGVIIATTNRPDIVDPALLRRFDEQYEFPGPDYSKLRALADKLAELFGIPPVDDAFVVDAPNYDAVTKVVEREARRIVMREILAAEAASESEEPEEHEEHGSAQEEDRENPS